MTVMSSPAEAALLAHVVSQIESNVQFLVSQNYLSSADASGFLSKLERVGNNNVSAARAPPAPIPRRVPSVPATSPVVKAKALWAYNEDGSAGDDLSFAVGDVIEVVEETNADWWKGKVNGREGLFPSNYVEKLQQSAPLPAPGCTLPPAFNGAKSNSEKPAYKPFMAAHSNAPPPPGAGINSIGLQQDSGQEQKKSKFGKYGNTMAHSAAGGVGFGAGAAIGGGLVRAIF